MSNKFILFGLKGFVSIHLLNVLNKYVSPDDILLVDLDKIGCPRIKNYSDLKLVSEHLDVFINTNIDSENIYFINLISASNVDWVQNNPVESDFINISVPKYLIEYISSFANIQYISFSSNAVYDGTLGNYSETSDFSPVNLYGEQKAFIDEYVIENSTNYMIFRPTTLFGDVYGCRSNPVEFIARNAIQKKPLSLVNDLYVNFGFVNLLVETIFYCLDKKMNNMSLNFGGPDNLSRYDLGVLIYKHFNTPTDLITPCSVSDFDNNTARPLNTSFDVSLLNSIVPFKNISITDYLSSSYYLNY